MSPRVLSQENQSLREVEIIQIARELIESDGVPALTIDKLVAAAPYSKGTIYNHFSGKEDLLIAICNECMGELVVCFQRAAAYRGSSRERIAALLLSYLIWSRQHPMQFFAVLSANSPSVIERASPKRLDIRSDIDGRLMSTVTPLIQQGIADGELLLKQHMSVERITFALWSSGFGALALVSTRGGRNSREVMKLEREYFTNIHLILDGLNWRPLSHEWDYRATHRQVANTVFADELAVLAQNGFELKL